MHWKTIRLFMIKKVLLVTVIFVFSTAFTVIKNDKEKAITKYPKDVRFRFPYIEKNFVAFKEAVAFKESQGKFSVVNTLGYLGKYQFGRTTLERFKIYDTQAFLNNPELQEKAFVAYCKVNKWILRKDIKRSVGKTINGIFITESGILAAAHLGGAGNVKKFLRSNGKTIFKDAYGSSVGSYLKKFANYDVSMIKADRKAQV